MLRDIMSRSYAFTLIELLVVIAVIAVLMAILMPALNLARDQGRKAVCSNNLHGMALANQEYATDWDDWGVPCRFYENRKAVEWVANAAFRKYIGYGKGDQSNPASLFQTQKKFKCPSDAQEAWQHAYGAESGYKDGTLVSYSFNIEDWYPSVGQSTWSATSGIDVLGYRMSSVKQPAMKLHFNEGHDWWCRWKGADYVSAWDEFGQDGTVMNYQDAGYGGPTLYRHNESVNLAFYDGHVEGQHKTKVWKLEHFDRKPYQPGIWVVKRDVWEKNAGF